MAGTERKRGWPKGGGRGLAVTGSDGRTPSAAEGRAIVITKRELRPTDDPARPQSIEHTYRLRVAAPGYAAAQFELATDAPLPRPFEVTLNRTEEN